MYQYQRVLGERVKAERLKHGLTQAQLAERIHSNKRTIIDIEKHRGNPKLETLFDLLTYLEIDPYIIFYPEPHSRSEALCQLELLLHDCPEYEIRKLVSICKAILDFANASRKVDAIKSR